MSVRDVFKSAHHVYQTQACTVVEKLLVAFPISELSSL